MMAKVLILFIGVILAGRNLESFFLQPSICGKWEVVEAFSSPPTGDGWSLVSDGFQMELKNDRSFKSSQFEQCKQGTYQVSEEKITLKFDCQGFAAGYEDPEGVFSYSFQLKNDTLVLNPENFFCYEGCKLKLVRKS